MIDYLEQSLERARQLLEELQKLERPLAGPSGGGAPLSGERQEALDGGQPAEEMTSPGGERPAGEMAGPGGERPTEEMTDPGGKRSGGEKLQAGLPERRGGDGPEKTGRGERSPLLAQVERLERAAALQNVSAMARERSAGSGAEQAGRRDGYPLALSGAGRDPLLPDMAGIGTEGWIPVGSPGRAGAAPADEMRWAERADRAFRRDSRRYDGGFYLY